PRGSWSFPARWRPPARWYAPRAPPAAPPGCGSRTSRHAGGAAAYSLTQRSMGMSAPFDRHLKGTGQRGGGGFLRIRPVVRGSRAGNPGRVGVRPCSMRAQGSAQKPRASILPRWSCCRRHTCALDEQSDRLLQLRPRPTVRGSLFELVLPVALFFPDAAGDLCAGAAAALEDLLDAVDPSGPACAKSAA